MNHRPDNGEFSELERELAQLQPAAPPEILAERLASALEESVPSTAAEPAPDPAAAFGDGGSGYGRSRLLRFLLAPSAAAAVVVAALAFALLRDPRTAVDDSLATGAGDPQVIDMGTDGAFIDPNVARFQPGSAQTILYDILDEGIVWNDRDEPMRQFRYRFLETVSLTNPSDGSTLRMDIPREEVIRVPVETF